MQGSIGAVSGAVVSKLRERDRLLSANQALTQPGFCCSVSPCSPYLQPSRSRTHLPVSLSAVAPSGMSFERLATVELQLIMHCCDQTSWLQLARCSRFTLQAASQSFAQRHLLLRFVLRHPFAPDAAPYSRGVWSSLKQLLGRPSKPRSLAERLQRSRLLRGVSVALTLPAARNLSAEQRSSTLSALTSTDFSFWW